MNKLLIIVSIFYSANVFAQDCISNPEKLSVKIGECIKSNNKECLKKYVATWDELAPLFDTAVAHKRYGKYEIFDWTASKKKNYRDKQEKIINKTLDKIDSLFAIINRSEINLVNSTVTCSMVQIEQNKNKLFDSPLTETVITLSLADLAIEILCEYQYINGTWRLIDINEKLWVYNSNGNHVGDIRIYYSAVLDTPTFADTEVQKVADEYTALAKERVALKNDSNNSIKAELYEDNRRRLRIQKEDIGSKLASSPEELDKWYTFHQDINDYIDYHLSEPSNKNDLKIYSNPIDIKPLKQGKKPFIPDCIPNPTNLSKKIADCIKRKDKKCLQNHIITYPDIKLLFESSYVKKSNEKDIKWEDVEKELKNFDNSDSLIENVKKLSVDWNEATIILSEEVVIGKENKFPAVFMAEGKIKLSVKNFILGISYGYILYKGEWKLTRISENFSVYNKKNQYLGPISEDFSDTPQYLSSLSKEGCKY